MNQHLAEGILSIVRKFSKEEVKEFISLNNKKSKSTDKKYVKLFNAYLEQIEEEEVDLNKLKASFPTLNDLNKNLKKKLIDYLISEYCKKQEEFESLEKIKRQILICKSLMEKGLYGLAEKEILPAYRIGKNLYLERRKNNSQSGDLVGYLTEIYFLVTELCHKNNSGNIWETEKELYENLIRPTVEFATFNHADNKESIIPGGFNNPDWQQYTFNEVLRIYYRERKEYDRLLNLNNKILTSHNVNIFGVSETNQWILLLWQFEKLYASLMTRNYSYFKFEFDKIKNQIFRIKESNTTLGIHFVIFCYRELFRLAVIYTGKQNDTVLVKDLNEMTNQQLYLFEENEIKNVGLHFYINNALLKFLMMDFKGYINSVEEQEVFDKLSKQPENYFPLRIMLLFAYRIGNIRSNLEYRERIEREINNKFLKENPDDFYIKLRPFLKEKYWNSSIDEDKFNALQKSSNPLDHFHQIILRVIEQYVKMN